jgi:hypothetical protein
MLRTGNTCAAHVRSSAPLLPSSTQTRPCWSPTQMLLPTAASAVMPEQQQQRQQQQQRWWQQWQHQIGSSGSSGSSRCGCQCGLSTAWAAREPLWV